MLWLVYCHRNKINNKRYIGITHYTDNPNKRWRDGKAYMGKKTHHKVFGAAITKYGWDNFEHTILEENLLSIEDANRQEKYWIAYYHTYIGDPDCQGYNMTLGGDGSLGRIMSKEEREYRRQLRLGKPLSEETKQKMSMVRKGKPQNMTQKKIDQINRMHEARRGKKMSPEAIEKIRLAGIGRTHSEETKQKISMTKKINNSSHVAKPGSGVKKRILCVETNEIFNSIIEAAKEKNISSNSIISCAKGRRHTAGGYHWKYID